jgi:hypothetical protein
VTAFGHPFMVQDVQRQKRPIPARNRERDRPRLGFAHGCDGDLMTSLFDDGEFEAGFVCGLADGHEASGQRVKRFPQVPSSRCASHLVIEANLSRPTGIARSRRCEQQKPRNVQYKIELYSAASIAHHCLSCAAASEAPPTGMLGPPI